MVSPVKGRAVIDMKTVQANIELIPDLLAAHTITGYDTVVTNLGCGKAIVVSKVLQSRNYSVMMIREVIHQATQFVLVWPS